MTTLAKPLSPAQSDLLDSIHAGATLVCFGVNLWMLRPVTGKARRVFAGTCKSLLVRGLIVEARHERSETVFALVRDEQAA